MSKSLNFEVNEDEVICTPPELKSVANIAMESMLPKKSKGRYEIAYNNFSKWQQKHKIENLFSENVLLAYFNKDLKNRSPSTLWSVYSMLRTMINLKNKVDISKYSNLIALLKNKNKGYKPKQAKVFTDEEVRKFIEKAPEEKYLATKVILVFGMLGACCSDELIRMTLDDVKRFDTPEKMYLVSISEESYFKIVEKYIKLHPNDMLSECFFITYHDGKCVKLNMGKNKISHAAKEIAEFLKLDPDLFTGHSFCRSSTTTLANAGADLLQIKHFGGWKSNTVAERYIDDSVYQKKKTELMIASSLSASTSQLNKPALPSHTETMSNIRNFTYKTPKFCKLPSQLTNIEASPIVMNIEEQEVRLSQNMVEEDYEYKIIQELSNRSSQDVNIEMNATKFRDLSTVSPN